MSHHAPPNGPSTVADGQAPHHYRSAGGSLQIESRRLGRLPFAAPRMPLESLLRLTAGQRVMRYEAGSWRK
jgi:hypothetical protein